MTTVEQVRVRSVTDDEVDFYADRGWVYLPELIDPGLAAELLARAQGIMGVEGSAHLWKVYRSYFHTHEAPRLEDELCNAVATSPEMGQNCARLIGREVAIRLLVDTFLVKVPKEKDDPDPPTPFHQDGVRLPYDRASCSVWIALDEVTPEMGMMRFRSGSQKLGPLGREFWHSEDELLGAWPRVAACPSEHPPALRPGDATVHSGLMVHSAPENTTDRVRWSYLLNVFCGDSKFDRPYVTTRDLDLEFDAPLEHPRFPVIYEP